MPKRAGGPGEKKMVPEAHFTSYYGKPIVKAAPWTKDIPSYLFLGGLAGGSSLLAVGADLTQNIALRKGTRLTAAAAIGASYVALVHDLGKPSRFVNMMRVAKPTSPMSVGTWIISAYGPAAGIAAAYEFRHLSPSKTLAALLNLLGRPAGVGAAILAPAVASYTAVLLSNTATPSWHHGFKEMPFVFVGSAASASGGMAMITSSIADAEPARRLGVGGAILELISMKKMEDSMGIAAEPLKSGSGGQLLKLSKIFTIAGLIGTVSLGKKNKLISTLSGLFLVLGSICTRFGIFEAGQNSTKDPKYTVLPQRGKN